MASFYAHFISDSSNEIQESTKVSLDLADNPLVNHLLLAGLSYLESKNDGNKVYSVLSISAADPAVAGPLPLDRYVSSYFEPADDVYFLVHVEVDESKHVQPIATRQLPPEKKAAILKYRTLHKYSYYESGKTWVKVLVGIPGIGDHPASKIEVSFGERTLDVFVHDFKGENLHFGVRKLQCKIKPEQSKWAVKSGDI